MGKIKGFTFIEILVVISLIGLVTTTSTRLFLNTLHNNNKARAILQTKQTGDNALAIISRQLRAAKTIEAAGCLETGSSSLTFTNFNDESISLSCSASGITLTDEGGTKNLIDSNLAITDFDSCFKCFTDAGDAPEVIEVAFTLQKGEGGGSANFNLHFSTTISLRNY